MPIQIEMIDILNEQPIKQAIVQGKIVYRIMFSIFTTDGSTNPLFIIVYCNLKIIIIIITNLKFVYNSAHFFAHDIYQRISIRIFFSI